MFAQTQRTEGREKKADRLNEQGIQQAQRSQIQAAIQSFQESLQLYREIGDRLGESNSLNNLGLVYSVLGQYEQALDFHQQSLAIAREVGDRVGESNSLNNLGLTLYQE